MAICPLVSKPIPSENGYPDMEWVECQGPNCAMFDQTRQECGVMSKPCGKGDDDKS